LAGLKGNYLQLLVFAPEKFVLADELRLGERQVSGGTGYVLRDAGQTEEGEELAADGQS
jgi:hypothetical protein